MKPQQGFPVRALEELVSFSAFPEIYFRNRKRHSGETDRKDPDRALCKPLMARGSMEDQATPTWFPIRGLWLI